MNTFAFLPSNFALHSKSICSRLFFASMLIFAPGITENAWSRLEPTIEMNNGSKVEDFEWDLSFSFNPGCDGPINAAKTFPDGWIFVAGSFSSCGDIQTQNIAKYHPSTRQWAPVGGGVDGTIYALERVDDGLLIGGAFSSAFNEQSSIAATSLAFWDGFNWSEFGGDVQGTVRALKKIDGSIYVGGLFTLDSWGSSTTIAKFNEGEWHAMDSVTAYAISSQVSNIIEVEGEPVVSARFERQDPFGQDYLARWDGSGWQVFGGGLNGEVLALSYGNGSLFAAGSFSEAGSISTTGVAYWNGVVWNRVPCGIPSYQNSIQRALHFHDDLLYIGVLLVVPNLPNVLQVWNGQECETLGTFGSSDGLGSIREIVDHEDSIFVFGSFGLSPGGWVNNAALYDGYGWARLGVGGGNGVDGVISSILSTEVGVYVAGGFTRAGEVHARNIALWNGESWQALEGLMGEGIAGGVQDMAYFDGRLYVGGWFTEAGGIQVKGLATWDGTDWSKIEPELTNAGDPGEVYVYSLFSSDSELLVGGYFTGADSLVSPGFIKWNGSEWEHGANLERANGAPTVTSILSLEDELYIGGSFDSVDGTSAANIAGRIEGSWFSLGEGIDPSGWPLLSAMYMSDDHLLVGGRFSIAGGVSVRNFAVWDGEQWLVGPGGNSSDSLAEIRFILGNSGCIFVGGLFRQLGSSQIDNLACLRDGGWQQVLNGVSGGVFAADIDPSGRLWIGGDFSEAGEVAASGVSVLTGPKIIFQSDFLERNSDP